MVPSGPSPPPPPPGSGVAETADTVRFRSLWSAAMPEADELERILRTGREGRAAEFKQTLSWAENATKAKVVKWALGTANLADGGVLAFGLQRVDPNPLYELSGMSQADHDSFNQDSVSTTVNAHATPHIDLSVIHLPLDDKL